MSSHTDEEATNRIEGLMADNKRLRRIEKHAGILVAKHMARDYIFIDDLRGKDSEPALHNLAIALKIEETTNAE